MELMIVVIIPMKNFAIMIVQKINLNAVAMADVFWAPGNVMATRIVLMALTKIRIFVKIVRVIRKRNSPATTANVSQFCGNAISIMTVVTTVMSRPTFAEIKTAQQVGVDAPGMQITDVFPNGCFAMAKMIVGMDRMSSMKIVHRVKRKEISVVETEDVFQNDGCVILKTIVVTTLMKMTRPVQDAIANVQNQNSDVATTSVFQADGNVIMTMIAETEVTKPLVERMNVQLTNSNVPLVIASKKV
jgi:hypothetical protein